MPIMKDAPPTRADLAKMLESLKKTVKELKGRVSKLEAEAEREADYQREQREAKE